MISESLWNGWYLKNKLKHICIYPLLLVTDRQQFTQCIICFRTLVDMRLYVLKPCQSWMCKENNNSYDLSMSPYGSHITRCCTRYNKDKMTTSHFEPTKETPFFILGGLPEAGLTFRIPFIANQWSWMFSLLHAIARVACYLWSPF